MDTVRYITLVVIGISFLAGTGTVAVSNQEIQVCSHPGVPHLHPIVLSLVPCPFRGYPSDWSQVPSQEGGTPVPGSQYPKMGYPLAIYPPCTHCERWGTPPGYDSKLSTFCVVGGMPLAFIQEDFLVFFVCIG